jgi:hypothetical protein
MAHTKTTLLQDGQGQDASKEIGQPKSKLLLLKASMILLSPLCLEL